MSQNDESVIELLKGGPMCCTEIGERLWGTRYRHRQCYARPAGKIVKRLLTAGRIKRVFPRGAEKLPPLYAIAKETQA